MIADSRPGIAAQPGTAFLEPVRFYGRGREGEQPGGFDKRTAHNPGAAPAMQIAAGEHMEFTVGETLVESAFLFSAALSEKPGQQGTVYVFIRTGSTVETEFSVSADKSMQLLMEIEPFPHALEGKIVALAEFL